jgi:hypothetical protein
VRRNDQVQVALLTFYLPMFKVSCFTRGISGTKTTKEKMLQGEEKI